jgi:hypothetical protein
MDGDNLIDKSEIEKHVESYLQTRLPSLLQAVTQQINISQIAAASGVLQNLSIDRLVLGDVNIDRLVIQGTTASIQSGRAILQSVRVNLELKMSLDWWVDVYIYSDSGSEDLGSISFNISIGDVLIPAFQNINLSIPTITAQNLGASISPVSNLALGNGSFRGLKAQDTTLPAQGFQLNGLGFSNLSLGKFQMPATVTRRAGVDDFTFDSNLIIPSATLSGIQLPATAINDIQSDPVAVDGMPSRRGVDVNLGIFGFTFWIQPIAHIQISKLLMQDVHLTASIPQVSLENMHIPVDVQGISMTDLRVNNLDITDITA